MTSLKIGWSAWEPALSEGNKKTSGGGGEWTSYLFSKFKEAGHEVAWLQPTALPTGTVQIDIEKCDVIVACWRWPMPDRSERQLAYRTQQDILGTALSLGIPIIIHDEDHKLPSDVTDYLSLAGHVFITAPELKPLPWRYKPLIFPNPYCEMPFYRQLTFPVGRDHDLVYIGNNYERFEQASRLIGELPPCVDTVVYGNWLEPNPERESPRKVMTNFKNTRFMGRLEQDRILQELGNALFTVHLFKPSYGPVGFMTIRWAEAVAAKTVALIPDEMWLPPQWEFTFGSLGLIVADAVDVEERITNFSCHEWMTALDAEMEFVNTFMKVQPWLDIVKEVTK